MIVFIMGVMFFYSIQIFAGEFLEDSALKWIPYDPPDSITLGEPNFSADNILTVYPCTNGYLAELSFKKELIRFFLKSNQDCPKDIVKNITDKRIAIVSNLYFFVAPYGQGITFNKVTYSKQGTKIEVVQIINMPELRNDVSYLSLNKNTFELAGSSWQFIRIWEKIKDKDAWKLKNEIPDLNQLEYYDPDDINKIKLNNSEEAIKSVHWIDDTTINTTHYPLTKTIIKRWNLETKQQIEKPKDKPIEEISLISAGSRVLSGLIED